MRCYPFKRKQEACFACWRPGHRKDVCPHPPSAERCTTCGTTSPQPNHPCTPSCILCGEAHLTGTAGCRNRFQPRRKTSTPAMARQDLDALSPHGQPSKSTTLPGNQLHHRTSATAQAIDPHRGHPSYSQVTQGLPQRPPIGHQAPVTQTVTPTSPPTQYHSSPSATYDQVIREMKALRETVLRLQQENARLAQENQMLRQRLTTSPATPATPSTPPAPPASSTPPNHAQPPPLKRKAESDTLPAPSDAPITPHELRTEYQTMFMTLQDQMTALQISTQELHSQMLEWMRSFAQNPPPSTNLTTPDAAYL